MVSGWTEFHQLIVIMALVAEETLRACSANMNFGSCCRPAHATFNVHSTATCSRNSFPTAHKKSLGFLQGFLSDADGTRTRNHRIDSPSQNSDFTKEKAGMDDDSESWASKGVSENCDKLIQTWIANCPTLLSLNKRLRSNSSSRHPIQGVLDPLEMGLVGTFGLDPKINV